MDFFVEFLFEFFLEGYVELMIAIIPRNRMSKKTYKVIKVAVIIVSVVTFAAILLGIIAIFSKDESTKITGIYALVIGLVITVIQVMVGIIGRRKQIGINDEKDKNN